MSTVATQNIKNPTTLKSIDAAYVTDGTAKARNYWNTPSGVPASIDSLNISSVTDNGTGDITHTFTNAFADANLTAAGMSVTTATGTHAYVMHYKSGAIASGSLGMINRQSDGASTEYDGAANSVVILGDLA